MFFKTPAIILCFAALVWVLCYQWPLSDNFYVLFVAILLDMVNLFVLALFGRKSLFYVSKTYFDLLYGVSVSFIRQAPFLGSAFQGILAQNILIGGKFLRWTVMTLNFQQNLFSRISALPATCYIRLFYRSWIHA